MCCGGGSFRGVAFTDHAGTHASIPADGAAAGRTGRPLFRWMSKGVQPACVAGARFCANAPGGMVRAGSCATQATRGNPGVVRS
ncbi:hypothetical protein BN2476_210087 [Paraburkholderia piptadeniae]|uniref:Uncharacterized protein n=1 Tax=Paraburkholderia piptadeniae TaxID=1701573 RepID=A0A1N7RVT6_9BURK|nr:hypothetical protein BN2476_210087 [Paraburkholderia piptadeniae]